MKKSKLKKALIYGASILGCTVGVAYIVKATKQLSKDLNEMNKLEKCGTYTVPKEQADEFFSEYKDYALAVSESRDGKTLVVEVLGCFF